MKHPEFGDSALEWMKKAEESGGSYLTSVLSIYEAAVIIAGLRGTNLKDLGFIMQVTESISELHGLDVVPLTLAQVTESHFLMEYYGLDFEDALHLATAMENDATRIVSNDRDFNRTPLKRVY